MSFIKSGLVAAAFTVAMAAPAAAGGCCGWGYSAGCCGAAYTVAPVVAYQPVLTYQPVVSYQPVVAYQPVAAYAVNQGPVYSGPGTDYSPHYYKPARPVAAYPYMPGYYDAPVYRPVRKYRPYGWGRPYYGVRKSYRWSGYHHPRVYRAPAVKYYK
jgi:hypothetical protein